MCVITLGNDHVGFKNTQFLPEITTTFFVHDGRLFAPSIGVGATLRRSHMNEEFFDLHSTFVFPVLHWVGKFFRCDEGMKKAPDHRQSFPLVTVQGLRIRGRLVILLLFRLWAGQGENHDQGDAVTVVISVLIALADINALNSQRRCKQKISLIVPSSTAGFLLLALERAEHIIVGAHLINRRDANTVVILIELFFHIRHAIPPLKQVVFDSYDITQPKQRFVLLRVALFDHWQGTGEVRLSLRIDLSSSCECLFQFVWQVSLFPTEKGIVGGMSCEQEQSLFICSDFFFCNFY